MRRPASGLLDLCATQCKYFQLAPRATVAKPGIRGSFLAGSLPIEFWVGTSLAPGIIVGGLDRFNLSKSLKSKAQSQFGYIHQLSGVALSVRGGPFILFYPHPRLHAAVLQQLARRTVPRMGNWIRFAFALIGWNPPTGHPARTLICWSETNGGRALLAFRTSWIRGTLDRAWRESEASALLSMTFSVGVSWASRSRVSRCGPTGNCSWRRRPSRLPGGSVARPESNTPRLLSHSPRHLHAPDGMIASGEVLLRLRS